jgi:hypothetical protein
MITLALVRRPLAVLPLLLCADASRGQDALRFYTLTPCRLADTREPSGEFGGPALTSGTSRSFTAANRCGVPADARALYVNATAIEPTDRGRIALSSSSAVPGTSTVNFVAQEGAAGNSTFVALAGGRFWVYPFLLNLGSVHLTVDILGYYAAPNASGAGPYSFHGTTGCRLLDTRSGPALTHGTPLPVLVQGRCGVPVGAKAVTATITAVAPTARGRFILYANDSREPAVSNINYAAGITARANGTVARLSAVTNGADLMVMPRGDPGQVHCVIDVTGYYQ